MKKVLFSLGMLISLLGLGQEVELKQSKKFLKELNNMRNSPLLYSMKKGIPLNIRRSRDLEWDEELFEAASKRVVEMYNEQMLWHGSSKETLNASECVGFSNEEKPDMLFDYILDKGVKNKGHRSILTNKYSQSVGIAILYDKKNDTYFNCILVL